VFGCKDHFAWSGSLGILIYGIGVRVWVRMDDGLSVCKFFVNRTRVKKGEVCAQWEEMYGFASMCG
jgi:hypothetical protein